MKLKKILSITTVAGLLAATAVTAAASPASVYGNLVGITEEEAKDLAKESETSFGVLADEAGLLDEYKAGLIDDITAKINEKVAEGQLTAEEGEERIAEITEKITTADAESLGFGKGRGRGSKGQKGQRMDLATLLEEEYAGDFSALQAGILDKHDERIEEAVEAEKLTAEEAAEKTAALTEAVNGATNVEELEEALKALRPERPEGKGFGGRGQGGRGGGFGGERPEKGDTETEGPSL